MSGYSRGWGELGQEFALVGESDPMLSEEVKGVLPGHAMITIGEVSSVMNNVTGGMHDLFTGQALRTVLVALGVGGVPAAGDPAFGFEFEQLSYKGDFGEDVPISLAFSPSVAASSLLYDNPWGFLLHAKGAETAANSSTHDHDNGALPCGFTPGRVFHKTI